MEFIPFDPKWQDQIIALHYEAMEDFKNMTKPDREDADFFSIEESYLSNGGIFVLNVVNHNLLAMGGYRKLSDRIAELKRMRIKKELRGGGMGSALLLFLEREATKNGIKELLLETAEYRTLTLRLYEKHGYKEFERGLYGNIPVVKYRKQI